MCVRPTVLYNSSSLGMVRKWWILTPFSRSSLTKSTLSSTRASIMACSREFTWETVNYYLHITAIIIVLSFTIKGDTLCLKLCSYPANHLQLPWVCFLWRFRLCLSLPLPFLPPGFAARSAGRTLLLLLGRSSRGCSVGDGTGRLMRKIDEAVSLLCSGINVSVSSLLSTVFDCFEYLAFLWVQTQTIFLSSLQNIKSNIASERAAHLIGAQPVLCSTIFSTSYKLRCLVWTLKAATSPSYQESFKNLLFWKVHLLDPMPHSSLKGPSCRMWAGDSTFPHVNCILNLNRPHSHGGHFPLTSRSLQAGMRLCCCVSGTASWKSASNIFGTH